MEAGVSRDSPYRDAWDLDCLLIVPSWAWPDSPKERPGAGSTAISIFSGSGLIGSQCSRFGRFDCVNAGSAQHNVNWDFLGIPGTTWRVLACYVCSDGLMPYQQALQRGPNNKDPLTGHMLSCSACGHVRGTNPTSRRCSSPRDPREGKKEVPRRVFGQPQLMLAQKQAFKRSAVLVAATSKVRRVVEGTSTAGVPCMAEVT